MADDRPSSGGDALDELSRRVAAARGAAVKDISVTVVDRGGMAIGMRMASEFASAIIVGVLLGIGVDHLFATAPWGLIVGLGLGFATGVVNLVRAARDYSARQPVGQALADEADEDS